MDGVGRRRQIVEALSESDEVQVAALATPLGCSEMTVRRDLEALERDGICHRVHGGATRARQTAEETPYAMRAFCHADEKARIGARCAELLDEGETVVLDGGTTAMEVARLSARAAPDDHAARPAARLRAPRLTPSAAVASRWRSPPRGAVAHRWAVSAQLLGAAL